MKYNFNLGSDNGNPISITNNRVTDRGQTFTYDQLNRISTAQTTATHSSDPSDCWGQAFGYDSTGNWSNLLSIAGSSSSYTGCTQGSLTVSVNANNQIVGDTYDAAGNLWVVPGTGGATYIYNAENQMTSTSNSSMSYIYDGDGNRVEKSGTKLYWYAGSEVLDETDTTGSVTNSSFNEYIFFGDNRIGRRDSSGDVFYYLADQIDSSRVIAEVPSGQTTATMCYDADFEPFGGEHTYTNTCSQNYKFTGKERDSESNLDNFGARYYASTTGRFMSPDWALKPISVPYAKFGDPQTLNLYTYVENSPLNRIDADGHDGGFSQGEADEPPHPGCVQSGGSCAPEKPADPDQVASQALARAQNNQPAPTNPDGSPKAPPTTDNKGNPIVPGVEGWKPGPGSAGGDRDTRWGPTQPVPADPSKGQGQPNASWDPNGHWDVKTGNKGETVRVLPDGTRVDHDNNPMPMSSSSGSGVVNFVREHPVAVGVGLVVVGGAAILFTGGGAGPAVGALAFAF